MADNKKIAEDVLKAVGGKDNVAQVTHCMTRLRLNLKDQGIPNDDEVKKINGVLGVARSGGQYQIIIGQNVPKVYAEVCNIGGFAAKADTEESHNGPKEKLTPKSIGMGIMDVLAGSLTPVIPVILAASFFKILLAVLGPSILGVLSPESDLYTLFTFVGDAGYYFFPLLVGYTAAKKMDVSPVMGIFMGGIMLHPTMVQMATEETAFTVYGIPCSVQNYASTLLPIILSIWAMSYVERFLKKIIPDTLKIMFVPVLTIAIMLPVSLCALGPAGAFLGQYICNALIAFGNTFGFVGSAVIGAMWQFLVMTGMHHVLIAQMIFMVGEVGYDSVIVLGAASSSLSVFGMCLGTALALRDKEEKSLGFGYAVSSLVGGVTEPGIYGIGIRYRKPLIGMMAGGFAGGLYAGLMGVKAFLVPPNASFLALSAYMGESTANIVNGFISAALSIIVAAVVSYVLCRKKADK